MPAAPPARRAARDADDDDEEELADGDEADPIEALVGRASTLFRRRRRNWVLVRWQGAAGARHGVQEREMDTPRRRALLAALKAATGGDEDPQGKEWVREVVDRKARGG